MSRETASKITMLRRHFNIKGEDLLGIYDTALAGLQPFIDLPYISLSTSKEVWDRVAANPNVERAKHPGTNVDCLKMFGNVYLRKQNRVADEDVVWVSAFSCYVPRANYLHNQFQHMLTSSSATKKIIAYANYLTGMLQVYLKEYGDKS